MRRIVIIAAALMTLVGASTASAQSANTYSGTYSQSEANPGSSSQHVGLSFGSTLTAASTIQGSGTQPITDLKLTLTKVNFPYYTHFPVCSANTIKANGTDAVCPAGSQIGSAALNGNVEQWVDSAYARQCNPNLDIFNGGVRKVVYYMTLPPRHTCDGMRSGSVPPWTGSVHQSGSNTIIDIPFPAALSTSVGGGLTYSLGQLNTSFSQDIIKAHISQTVLKPVKVKKKVKVKDKKTHKTKTETKTVTEHKRVKETVFVPVPFFQTVGCAANKTRPWTQTVTDQTGGAPAVTTFGGAAPC
ncbi:MAG: hypothetical protein J2O48_11060 [Solirubrobacterales bacterium]|nr:hypothetical protein [Solirubrobacterales bacterium]